MRSPSFASVDLTGRSAVLAVGDALAIAVFVAAGELRHEGSLASGALTYAEFLVGWAIAAVLLGAYAPDALDSRARAVGVGLLGWLGGALLGQVVRAVVEPGFFVPPSFVAVSLGFGGLAIAIWRGIAATLL